MESAAFVYTIYIQSTPDEVWPALTTADYIERYFHGGNPQSSWEAGAHVLWRAGAGQAYQDWGQRVLEADPPRCLSYTWFNYRPEIRQWFDCTDEQFAEMQKEPISKVTLAIEPAGEQGRLALTHAGFAPGSQMLAGISTGWPMHLSALKSLLEAGQPATAHTR